MTNKYKITVYWWIRTDGQKKQGHDAIETNWSHFDEEDASILIERDLARDVAIGNGMMPSGFPSQDAPTNLPNFYKEHSKLMIESTYAQVSNWGVRKVKAEKILQRVSQ